jgi:hypothetical protein
MSDGARVALSGRHLRVLVRATRETLAGGLLRASEVGDAYDVLELLDSKLPTAKERHPVGAGCGRHPQRTPVVAGSPRGTTTGR